MMIAIKQRLDREDEGFTLIELMVVVLIIAILLAIAIPTFLGARNTANARSAQSNLRNALTAEQSYWTNNQTFDTTGTGVATFETALTFTNTGPVLPGKSVLLSADTDGVVMTAAAKDGNCYSIEVINVASGAETPGTYYYQIKGTGAGSNTSCNAPAGVGTAAYTPVANANANTGAWASAF
jgi:type IV pilus assembly protein PilA